jgi:ubiquinone/menaquinone biosynthesis C-methylase UbiE
MEEVTAKTQMEKIRRFEKGFMAMHLINLGEKVGILEELNKYSAGLTTADLAARLQLHEPYLKTWCQTAYHLEILDCDDQRRFRLQPFLNEILGDKNHVRNYLANIAIDVDLSGSSIDQAFHFFRTGEVIKGYTNPEVSKMLYATTKNIYLAFLFMILPKNEQLKNLFNDGIKLLDIGCGDGSLIIQLAQAFPQSRFVGINPDGNGIEMANATIAQQSLKDRVSVEHIGGEAITYKDEFDLISMVVTLHEIIPGIRKTVMEKAYQALKTGGSLLILDFPYPSKLEDFRNPIYDYGILDQFYESCIGTVHLNVEEQNNLIRQVGFNNINRLTIGKGMFDFITASK